jgi:hypothetical protein
MTPLARRRLLDQQRSHSPTQFLRPIRRPPHGYGIVLAALVGLNLWIWLYVIWLAW